MVIKNHSEFSDMEIAVLNVMHSKGIYSTNHKQIETIMKSGFPKDKYGEIKKAIKSLMKRGYILWYDRSRKAIHLNKEKSSEISNIVKKS